MNSIIYAPWAGSLICAQTIAALKIFYQKLLKAKGYDDARFTVIIYSSWIIEEPHVFEYHSIFEVFILPSRRLELFIFIMSFMSRISVHQTGQSKLSKPMEMPPSITQNKSSRATDSGPSRGTMSNMSLLLGYRASAVYRSTKGGFKVPRYQNTYRLAPYNPFKCEVVDKILEDVMTMTLKGMKYNPAVCMKLCQDMSIEIRNRIFKKDYDRYKYVVTMTIIEKTGQSINMGLSRLWDVERDTYSTYIFENTDLYAVGAVIGLYYE